MKCYYEIFDKEGILWGTTSFETIAKYFEEKQNYSYKQVIDCDKPNAFSIEDDYFVPWHSIVLSGHDYYKGKNVYVLEEYVNKEICTVKSLKDNSLFALFRKEIREIKFDELITFAYLNNMSIKIRTTDLFYDEDLEKLRKCRKNSKIKFFYTSECNLNNEMYNIKIYFNNNESANVLIIDSYQFKWPKEKEDKEKNMNSLEAYSAIKKLGKQLKEKDKEIEKLELENEQLAASVMENLTKSVGEVLKIMHPEVDKIFVNETKRTIAIKWKDGNVTKAICDPQDKFDLEKGVLVALAKKTFSFDEINRYINWTDKVYQKGKKKEKKNDDKKIISKKNTKKEV